MTIPVDKRLHFKWCSKQDVLSLTRVRPYETKIGERLQAAPGGQDPEDFLRQSDARFVLLGIPEDIGVRANLGQAGADTGWLAFLQSFLNMQSNDFLDGHEMMLLGHFDFGDIQFLIDHTARGEEEKLLAYRHAVNAIDEEVEQMIKLITSLGKTPVVIGGGHNNAYPIIKGAAKGWHKQGALPAAHLQCINLDAHADFRTTEGRHSGNPFRYAMDDGYLNRYCVLGMHENYVPQNVWHDILEEGRIDCITFEDIFLYEKRTFLQAIAHAVEFTAGGLTGLELDLDAVAGALSSATSPSGITAQHARQFVHFAASQTAPAYLHICEGACRMADGRVDMGTGKLIAYLVADFLKAMQPQGQRL